MKELSRMWNWEVVLRAFLSSAGFIAIIIWFKYNNVWLFKFDEAGFSYVIANVFRILFVLYFGWLAFYIGRLNQLKSRV